MAITIYSLHYPIGKKPISKFLFMWFQFVDQVCVWIAFAAFQFLRFPFFLFSFFSRVFSPLAATVHVRYMNSSRNFWPVFREQYIRALFTDPQISFFINFFIKNGSHGIIYTFKNYFATVISAINFQFQQNKSYPNRPQDDIKALKGRKLNHCYLPLIMLKLCAYCLHCWTTCVLEHGTATQW